MARHRGPCPRSRQRAHPEGTTVPPRDPTVSPEGGYWGTAFQCKRASHKRPRNTLPAPNPRDTQVPPLIPHHRYPGTPPRPDTHPGTKPDPAPTHPNHPTPEPPTRPHTHLSPYTPPPTPDQTPKPPGHSTNTRPGTQPTQTHTRPPEASSRPFRVWANRARPDQTRPQHADTRPPRSPNPPVTRYRVEGEPGFCGFTPRGTPVTPPRAGR